MKKSNGKKAPSTGCNVTLPLETKIGVDMTALNKRARQITARLGVINAESAKLHAEQHGIDMRREKLRREFDTASNP